MSTRVSFPIASSAASSTPVRPAKRGRRGTLTVFGLGVSLIAGSGMFWLAAAPNALADGLESNPPSTVAGNPVSGSKSDQTPPATKAAAAASPSPTVSPAPAVTAAPAVSPSPAVSAAPAVSTSPAVSASPAATKAAAVSASPAVAPASAQKAGEAYAKGKAFVAATEWANAVVQLEQADKAQPNNADTNNLLGFASRKLGKLDVSLAYYQKALAIDPKHLGAHEYLGELYLTMKNPVKAKVELASLSKLCGVKCEQFLDLKKAIAAYKPVAPKKK